MDYKNIAQADVWDTIKGAKDDGYVTFSFEFTSVGTVDIHAEQ